MAYTKHKTNKKDLELNQHELEPLDVQTKNEDPNANYLEEELASDNDHRCGWGPFSCSSIDSLTHPIVFAVVMMIVVVLQISAVGIYLSGILSTIEKRFQLKSSESGFMTTINDIFGLAFVLPVTYVGHKLHRPRIIACGTLLVGIGTIVCALPQFIYANPSYAHNTGQNNETDLIDYCVLDLNQGRNESTKCSSQDIENAGSQLDKAMWFFIGQALCGIGQAPIWPLTLTFLDDNVGKSNMPAYLALFFTSTALTPMYGYALSAACLSLDVDFYLKSDSEETLQPGDPNFIGAWWLGFIVNGLALCFLSIIVFAFPRVLSKKPLFKRECKMLQNEKPKQAKLEYADMIKGPKARENMSLTTLIKDFFQTVKRLFTNPAYVCVVWSLIAELSIIGGFGIFTAKYIQKQYGIPASKASIVLGTMLTPATLLGVSSCGLFLKKYCLKVRGFARLAVITTLGCLVLGASLLATGCNNPKIAGLTVDYYENTNNTQLIPRHLPNLTTTCNEDCSCDISKYTPVCGGDGITYASPCHAGCTEKSELYDEKENKYVVYQECSCIKTTHQNNNVVSGKSTMNSTLFDLARVDLVSAGQCDADCNKLVTFAVMYAILIFVNSWLKNPSLMLLLRVVHEDDRTIAMGFNSVAIKLLGLLPAPIYFGAAIESTCILWNESCGETGDCQLYDIVKLRYVFIGLFLGLKCVSLMGYTSVTVLAGKARANTKHFTALPNADVKTNAKDSETPNGAIPKHNEQF